MEHAYKFGSVHCEGDNLAQECDMACVQGFMADEFLLLPILKALAQCIHSLCAT